MKQLLYRSLNIFYLLAAVLYFKPLSAQTIESRFMQNRHVSSAALISQAYNRKEITRDYHARLLAYTLFEPSKLPEEFVSNEPERCGTAVFEELISNLNTLSSETLT